MVASASANELSVETRPAGAHTIVIVIGRVTVDSSPHLRPVLHEAIGAAPPAGVVIDLTAARSLDTSAIATLLEAATLASKRGVPLRVIGLGGEAGVVAKRRSWTTFFSHWFTRCSSRDASRTSWSLLIRGCGTRRLPRGPVLPAEGVRHRDPAPAGARRGYSPAQ